MKFMSTWSAQPGALKEAVSRFLVTQGKPPAGVTQLGRWHSADLGSGFTLYESDNPAAVYESAAVWSDLLDINTSLVIEDAEAGPILAKVFKQ
jgi:hypothetical protein